jgi:outer membrane protein assembly factor BamB
MLSRILAAIVAVGLAAATTSLIAGDWNQWRGAQRDGTDPDSPPLIGKLPSDGLQPLWTSASEIPTGGSGGWSSPVVAGGRVFVFAHVREKKQNVELPPRKFPDLTEEQEAALSPDELSQYEANRRREQIAQRELGFSWTERIDCYDAASGELVWRNQASSKATRFPQSGTPAVVDGRVIVHGARGGLRAIDAATGDVVWQVQLPGEFAGEHHASSIAVADGVAVVAAGLIYGVSAADGKLLWQFGEAAEENSSSSPVVWQHGDRSFVIANFDRGTTVCLDPRDGRQLWEVKSEAGRSTPVVVGDRVITYGNSRKGGLRCYEMSLDGAEQLWTSTAAADEGCSPVVVGEHVYAHGDRKVVCVDLASGKTQWRRELDRERPRYTSLVAADDKVIFAAEGLLLFAASPGEYEPLIDARIDKTGRVASEEQLRKLLKIDELERTAEGQKQAESLWRKEVLSSGPAQCISPALADGRIFLRLKSGRVACYDLREAK